MKWISKAFVPCVSVAITMMSILVVPVSTSASENPLQPYQSIIDNFNEEYGTEFMFSDENVLLSEGSSKEEMVIFFTSMSYDEFNNYLFDAYERSIDFINSSKRLPETKVIDVASVCDANNIAQPRTIVTTSTQRYYAMTDNYFWVTASWVSVDGANRYVSYIDAGIYYVPNTNHYQLISITGYQFVPGSYMQQLKVSYRYTYQSAYGVSYGLYDQDITYTAGLNIY